MAGPQFIVLLSRNNGGYMKNDLRVFVTRSGREIALQPIATKTLDDLQLLIQEAENIRPPTYSVSLAGGIAEEEVEHDLTTLKTSADHAAWTAYEKRQSDASENVNKRVTRSYIIFGINENVPDNEWEQDFEFCGITVPTGAMERKVFYFERIVLADPADQRDFVQRVYLISQLSGEALERADALFRRAMENGDGLDATRQIISEEGALAA